MHRFTARARAVIGALALAAIAAACAPPPPAPPAGWEQRYLTRDGHDVTSWRPTGPDIAEAHGEQTNSGTNSRALFTRTADAPRRDDEACVTFSNTHRLVQEGVAFRVRDGTHGPRALTVTKNIFGGAHRIFNVHSWGHGGPVPFRQHGSVDMSHVLGGDEQGSRTWGLCARVTGTRVDVKVWDTAGGGEPAWDSPDVRTATVPAAEVATGRTGWYAGHVPPGHRATLSALRVGPDPADQEIARTS